jgi:hypothetical protein
MGFGMGELILIALIVAGVAFWLVMLIDCLQNESEHKLVWVVVLLLLHLLGAFLYWGMRKRPRAQTRSLSGSTRS